MKKNLLFVLLLVFVIPITAQQVMFPTPAVSKAGKGTFTVAKQVGIDGNSPYATQIASLLKSGLASLDFSSVSASGNIEIKLDKNCDLQKEGYCLEVTPQKMTLTASSESGLYYGYQGILQMARFGKGSIKSCKIVNYPRYEWRGFLLDESRHFFGKEKVKQYLDLMAGLNLNVFHWHLTDVPGWRIEIKRYPKLTTEGSIGNWHDPKAPASFYTQEDIKEIVSYAAERHIMIVPEFDMPGHATAVCRSYPHISGGGEGTWEHFTFHPCKDETYEFIGHIFDELFELFPSPYIHIGADEVHFGNQSWYTDPMIQKFIKDKNLMNEVGLEHYFIRRIADIVAEKGRTIITWDEAIDAGVSPDKAVIMWWRHDRKHQLIKALEKGYRVVMTPRRPMYSDFVQYGQHKVGRFWGGYNPIEDVYNFPASIMNLLQGYEDQILGVQMSMWSERVADAKRLDFMVFPRLIALSESAWTLHKNKECSTFMQKLPYYLRYLDTLGIYYFNPFAPDSTPEPSAPEKDDVLQNG